MTKRTIQELITYVNTLDESVVITDKNWDGDGPHCVYANPKFTELTGYTLADIAGKNMRILQGPDTDRKVMDELKRSVQAGERFEGQTWNYNKHGKKFLMQWVIGNIGPKYTDYYYAVQRDVTHLKCRQETENSIKDLQNLIKDVDFFLVGETVSDLRSTN